ncbi:MAG: AAA family ATPase [Desulfovermiculus sp.]|nr:AAA family ATPase [Desulfovermiculus sp.]
MRDARHILESQNIRLPYSSIVVDEAQEMGTQAFKLLRQMVPEGANDLFIVGDGHQRIYRHKVVLGRCGIKIVGRSRKLRVNYRTTEETRRWATGILEGVAIDDLDEGQDSEKGTTSLLRGEEPLIKHFDSFNQECQFLADLAKQKEQEGTLSTTCLVARTHTKLKQYTQALQQRGIAIYPIKTSAAEDRNASGLRLATMHRVKGLEFDTIIIAGANDGDMPLRKALESTDDDAEREDRELRERALFYVAATRAQKEVVVTSFGQKSVFLVEGVS